jgi:hypothetical protein
VAVWLRLWRTTGQPVLRSEPSDPTERPQIPGDDDQSAAARRASDQRIVTAHALTLALQLRTHFGGVGSGRVIECQSAEAAGETIDFPAIFCRAVGFFRTDQQFHQDDGRDTQGVTLAVEALTQPGGTIAQDPGYRDSYPACSETSEGFTHLYRRLLTLADVDSGRFEKVVPYGVRGHDDPAGTIPENRDLSETR